MFPIPFKRLLFQQCEGTDHKELITQLLIMACVCTCGCTGVFVCMSEVRERWRDKKREKGFDVYNNKKIILFIILPYT